ncbi:eukaryotic translation initiation factor 2-alpha kinase-like [Corticium candelabrum]|uniref:eukaryotic translation initiation factor 2-alpha kinase-like n=1 Tax=Corticium candelabrum TaxID=121492 RepID=UPI002E26439D|nr:eukaryotic translation initiation factor 2-alpha kinase-like [Corticium candelabrum]
MWRFFLHVTCLFCLCVVSITQECPRRGGSTTSSTSSSCLLLASTLDGKITALDRDGSIQWSVRPVAGPLLSSSLSTLESGANEPKLIPSLDGNIYHWKGNELKLLPVTADGLLSSPFQLPDGSLLVGSKEIMIARVNADSGEIVYLCSASGCHQNNVNVRDSSANVLIVRRIQRTVRAIVQRTGEERWNFTVGRYEIRISEGEGTEATTRTCFLGSPDWNLKVMGSEGVLTAIHGHDGNLLWSLQFSSPLSAVWSVDGTTLKTWPLYNEGTAVQPLNMGQSSIGQNSHPQFSPVTILGLHDGQLYVHSSTLTPSASVQVPLPGESVKRLSVHIRGDPAALTTYSTRTDNVPDTTALTVYCEVDDLQGDGMYLYSDGPKIPLQCEWPHPDIAENNTDAYKTNRMLDLSLWDMSFALTVIVFISAVRHYAKKRVVKRQKSEPVDVEGELDDSGVGSVLRQCSGETVSSNTRHSESFVSMFERDYEIVGVLGRGGFGEVYNVKKPLDDCSYAVKRIRLPRKSEARERVLREVKALAKLDHPHIIRYYTSWEECPPIGFTYRSLATDTDDTIFSHSGDELTKRESKVPTNSYLASMSGGSSFITFADESQQNSKANTFTDNSLISEDDTDVDDECDLQDTESNRLLRTNSESGPVFLYIQMELCKETLKDWLAHNSINREYVCVIKIFHEIVTAVEYVHAQEMMHRDLKPSNILFAHNGSVKVSDFGLVKSLTKTPSCNTTTKREPLQYSEFDDYDANVDSAHITSDVGTELYMSPEQVAGQPYCEKVDVYSMGVILFELLTPFTTQMERAKTLSRVRTQHIPDTFRRKHRKEYELICSLLAEHPDDRPSAKNIKNHSLLDEFK